MERLRSKIFAGLAVLSLAGTGVTVAAATGNASTSDCASCINLTPKASSSDIAVVSGGTAQAGQKVILSTGLSSADFILLDPGTVQDFYNAGIIGPAVGLTWPDNNVYEFEYAPAGTDSGLCLGTPKTAADGVAAELETCGVNARTTWIPLPIDNTRGFEPLINGTDTNVNTPFVLTAGSVGDKLTTSKLDLVAGTFDPAEMWQF